MKAKREDSRAGHLDLASVRTLHIAFTAERNTGGEQRLLSVIILVASAVAIGSQLAQAVTTPPVSPHEWAVVLSDWLKHGRFAGRHSCAAVVVARTHAPPTYKEGTPLVHALDVYERSTCSGSGSAAAIRVGMSDRRVADLAGAPVPWRSGPHCWWYRKPVYGRSVCFSSDGYVNRILISQTSGRP